MELAMASLVTDLNAAFLLNMSILMTSGSELGEMRMEVLLRLGKSENYHQEYWPELKSHK